MELIAGVFCFLIIIIMGMFLGRIAELLGLIFEGIKKLIKKLF